MHSLRGSFSKDDLIDGRRSDVVHLSDVLSHAFTSERDTKRVSVAACTDNLVEDSLSSISGIDIDGLIANEVRIENTRNDLSEESYWFLMELLRIPNVTECDLIERVILIIKQLL